MKRKIHLKKRNKFNLKKVPKINIIIILDCNNNDSNFFDFSLYK